MLRIPASAAVLSSFITLGCFHDLSAIDCDDRGACTPGSTAITTDEATRDPASTSTTTTTTTSSTSSTTTTAIDPDTSSADTSSATSTGPAASCGDGIVQPGPPLFEECDDGLADEQCNLLCKRNRVAFVASMPLLKPGSSPGSLQGLEGADNYCVSRAGMAGLPQFLLFKAFLSDSQHDAGTRLFNGEGRYILVDGTVIADDWNSLLTQPLQHPIELTEKGEVLHVSVWTGTEYGTGKLVPGADNCDDWTSTDLAQTGYWGRSNEVDSQWVYSDQLNPTYCIDERSIYCVEQQ